MYLVGSLFIIGGISLVVMGSLLGAVAIYVGGGLAWLAHNRRLPALYQIMAPSIAIALLWPLGLLIHLWMMFKDPKRFVVYDSGNPGDESAQGVLKELGAFSSIR